MYVRLCIVCVQTVGDLQCDSYSETAANPVLLYVIRAAAAPSVSDAGADAGVGADMSDLNLHTQSQSSRDRSMSSNTHARGSNDAAADR
jgi:hypothetical protein